MHQSFGPCTGQYLLVTINSCVMSIPVTCWNPSVYSSINCCFGGEAASHHPLPGCEGFSRGAKIWRSFCSFFRDYSAAVRTGGNMMGRSCIWLRSGCAQICATFSPSDRLSFFLFLFFLCGGWWLPFLTKMLSDYLHRHLLSWFSISAVFIFVFTPNFWQHGFN